MSEAVKEQAACRDRLHPCPHTAIPVHVCVLISSYKAAGPIGLGRTLVPPFNLISFVETIFPNTATRWGAGSRTPTYPCEGTQFTRNKRCQGRDWQWQRQSPAAGQALGGIVGRWSRRPWLPGLPFTTLSPEQRGHGNWLRTSSNSPGGTGSGPRGSCFWGRGRGQCWSWEEGLVWLLALPAPPELWQLPRGPVTVSQRTRVMLQLWEPYSPALELWAARLCRLPGPSPSPGRPLFCAPCPQVAAPPSVSPLGRVSAPRPLPREGGVPAACTGPQYP